MLTLLLEVAILLKNDFICDTNNTGKNTGQDTENSFPSRFNTASENREKNSLKSAFVFNHCQATEVCGFSAQCGSSPPHQLRHWWVDFSPNYLTSCQILRQTNPNLFFKHFPCCVTAERSSNHLTIFTSSRQVWRPVKRDIASSEASPWGWKKVFFVERGVAAFSLIDHFKSTMVRF